MKQLIGLTLGILVSASTIFAAKGEGDKNAFDIDTKASKIHWTGKKVAGEHTGYLSIGEGKVHVDDGKVVGANVNMDLNTIVVTDLEPGEWNDKLVGHLKSEDFFSVDEFPTASFKITDMKANSNEKYDVTGDLTIKGQTHEISFPATVQLANNLVTAKGTATIDRTKWDIQYGSGKFFKGLGDKMIYDDFEITFDIQAKPESKGLTLR